MNEEFMFINSADGPVHRVRNHMTCRDGTRNMRRIKVSNNQCLVYRLRGCTDCWSDNRAYETHIGIRRM